MKKMMKTFKNYLSRNAKVFEACTIPKIFYVKAKGTLAGYLTFLRWRTYWNA